MQPTKGKAENEKGSKALSSTPQKGKGVENDAQLKVPISRCAFPCHPSVQLKTPRGKEQETEDPAPWVGPGRPWANSTLAGHCPPQHLAAMSGWAGSVPSQNPGRPF